MRSTYVLEARALKYRALPLCGVPFAVTGTISMWPGMPDHSRMPGLRLHGQGQCDRRPARLRAAGAIPIGKTNLDQFATGLVGALAYGVPRNVFDEKLIPGGIELRLRGVAVGGRTSCRFSLGNSIRRAPAACRQGSATSRGRLKPSLGMVSHPAGVVPACRTLDCVSAFALTVDDAWAAFAAMAGPDIADRIRATGRSACLVRHCRTCASAFRSIGERVFFGDQASAAQFDAAIDASASLGATIVGKSTSSRSSRNGTRLLYEGPCARRALSCRARKLIA